MHNALVHQTCKTWSLCFKSTAFFHQRHNYVVKYLQSSAAEADLDEAPSGEQSSCHQSVQTTSRGTHSVADWDSVVVQTGCENTAAHSLEELQIRLMQTGYL